ncbi:MAG: hypothetical protein DMF83_00305 [Acidobacteria bacterium]|nr:MAG: hypothetical protein DMF83_00305 [Acidobacteriota bacterium]
MSYFDEHDTPSELNWNVSPFPLAELPLHCPAMLDPAPPAGALPPEPPAPLLPDPPLPEPPPPPPAATATRTPAAATTPPTIAILGRPPPACAVADVPLDVELPDAAPGAAPVLETITPSELKPVRSAWLSSALAATALKTRPAGLRAMPTTIGFPSRGRKRAILRAGSQSACFFTTRGVNACSGARSGLCDSANALSMTSTKYSNPFSSGFGLGRTAL